MSCDSINNWFCDAYLGAMEQGTKSLLDQMGCHDEIKIILD